MNSIKQLLDLTVGARDLSRYGTHRKHQFIGANAEYWQNVDKDSFFDYLRSLGYGRTQTRVIMEQLRAMQPGSSELLRLLWNAAVYTTRPYGERIEPTLKDLVEIARTSSAMAIDIHEWDDPETLFSALVAREYEHYLETLDEIFPEGVPVPVRVFFASEFLIRDIPKDLPGRVASVNWEKEKIPVSKLMSLVYDKYGEEEVSVAKRSLPEKNDPYVSTIMLRTDEDTLLSDPVPILIADRDGQKRIDVWVGTE